MIRLLAAALIDASFVSIRRRAVRSFLNPLPKNSFESRRKRAMIAAPFFIEANEGRIVSKVETEIASDGVHDIVFIIEPVPRFAV